MSTFSTRRRVVTQPSLLCPKVFLFLGVVITYRSLPQRIKEYLFNCVIVWDLNFTTFDISLCGNRCVLTLAKVRRGCVQVHEKKSVPRTRLDTFEACLMHPKV